MTIFCEGVHPLDLLELPRYLSADRVRHEWPPPGTTVSWSLSEGLLVCGTPPADPGTWYVAPLAEVAGSTADPGGFLDSVADAGVPGWATWSGPLEWPYVYVTRYHNEGGPNMRWLRVTLAGDLAGTEHFQHKVDLGIPGADPTTSEAAALAYAAQFAGYWQTTAWDQTGGVGEMCSTQVRYRECGVAELVLNSAGGTPEYTYGTQWAFIGSEAGSPGRGTGLSLPFEVSCAVTFGTTRRGPSGRGRTYLPPFSTSAMASGGFFTAAAAQSAADALAHFFNSITAGTTLHPVVVSQAHQYMTEITSVSAGLVPDSQRRRRRSQVEANLPSLALVP